MPKSRAHFLIDQLIRNSLSEKELEELLTSVGKDEMNQEYSELLEHYFNHLLKSDPTKLADPPPNKN